MSTSDDKKIWETYAKRVKRAATRKANPAAKSEIKSAAKSVTIAKTSSHTKQAAATRLQPPIAVTVRPIEEPVFDRKIERQLRDGHIIIDARLDLHGMTQAVAHNALAHFITAQHKTGSRKLLIITGKGRGNQGVLRANLPQWLASFKEAPDILTLRPAALKHGGDGAFYVLLKKRKPKY
jgi:DNA-nicking Smr family endonuclease